MKVFVLTLCDCDNSSLGDFSVVGVYVNKEDAEAARAHDMQGHKYDYEIVEHDVK